MFPIRAIIEHVAAVLDSTLVRNTSPSGWSLERLWVRVFKQFTYAQNNLPAAHVSDAVLFCVQVNQRSYSMLLHSVIVV